jgi:NhaP-type Na+/H+ and K+/H+ antiporter
MSRRSNSVAVRPRVLIAHSEVGSEVLSLTSTTRFHDGLAWLMQIAMFLTLGLLVFPLHIVPVLGVGILVAVFLMFVARPASAYLSLLRSRFGVREQTLIGWVGLRGAAGPAQRKQQHHAGASTSDTARDVSPQRRC